LRSFSSWPWSLFCVRPLRGWVGCGAPWDPLESGTLSGRFDGIERDGFPFEPHEQKGKEWEGPGSDSPNVTPDETNPGQCLGPPLFRGISTPSFLRNGREGTRDEEWGGSFPWMGSNGSKRPRVGCRPVAPSFDPARNRG